MTSIDELFERFLVFYFTGSRKYTDEAMNELRTLTRDYVENCHIELFFTSEGVSNFVSYVERKISDKNKGFFNYTFHERRYIWLLEEWFKWLITEYVKNK